MENKNPIYEPLPGLRERRFAAFAHASIIAFALGIAAGPFLLCFMFPFIPFGILISFNKKDKWIASHARQALIFQLVLSFIILLIGLPAFVFVFARCAPGFGHVAASCNDVFLPMTLVIIVAWIIVPLGMVLFGFVRGILLLSGSDIEYPLVSRLLRKDNM